MNGMSRLDIRRLVERYIGSSMGYLGTFGSHPDLTRFYLDCGLDIDPLEYQGTNKARFQAVLENAEPDVQAKIIRGILRRHPPDASSAMRTRELHDEFLALAEGLESGDGVKSPEIEFTTEVVRRAIDDAEKLIRSSGATSGVDRIHTALHGYLKDICKKSGIECGDDPTMTSLFKALRREHPALVVSGPRADDVSRVLQSIATIMDAMNPIRNNASMAHPKELLDEPEAMLVINSARTILQYVDLKVP
jgi:hypothetical protein